MYRKIISPLTAILAAVTMLLPAHLAAQQTSRTRIPLTIALVDRLPVSGAPAVLLRRMDVAPQDVILLPRDADAGQLSSAVQLLLLARRQGGDHPARDAVLRPRPRPDARRVPRPFPWAPRVVADLRRAAPRSIPGVGTVPAVDVWLPPTPAASPSPGRRR